MKKVKVLMLVLLLVVFVGSSEAGWKDNLKKFGDGVKKTTNKTKEAGRRTKERWKESERRCDICNKVVHGRNRCTSCQAKRVSNQMKRAGNSVKKTYNDMSHPCTVCGAKTRLKGRCSRCVSKSVKAGGKKVVRFSKDASKKTKEVYGRSLDRIKDPETKRKATKAATAVLEFRRKYKETKRKVAYEGMKGISSIPIPGKNGEMTKLGDFASERLLDKYPELSGTGICDDPAETVAAMICTDRKYFLKEMKFVKSGGRNISVYEAVEESTAFNSAKAMKSFKVMAAAERVANTYYTGEDSVEALTSVADAINSINN